MPRWEYLQVQVNDGVVMDFPEALGPDATEEDMEDYASTERYFNRLGAQGWELVCSGGEDSTIYTFKRTPRRQSAKEVPDGA